MRQERENRVSSAVLKYFLYIRFEWGKRGNFALQSEWEIANSLLAAAKWGNQTLGRIYSPRSTLFSISMHSSTYFLRYPARNETLWRNLSPTYFHSCQTYLSKSHSDMFLLYSGFNNTKGMRFYTLFCLLLYLGNREKRELLHWQAQVGWFLRIDFAWKLVKLFCLYPALFAVWILLRDASCCI